MSDTFDAFVLADTLRHEYRYWRPIAAGPTTPPTTPTRHHHHHDLIIATE